MRVVPTTLGSDELFVSRKMSEKKESVTRLQPIRDTVVEFIDEPASTENFAS